MSTTFIGPPGRSNYHSGLSGAIEKARLHANKDKDDRRGCVPAGRVQRTTLEHAQETCHDRRTGAFDDGDRNAALLQHHHHPSAFYLHIIISPQRLLTAAHPVSHPGCVSESRLQPQLLIFNRYNERLHSGGRCCWLGLAAFVVTHDALSARNPCFHMHVAMCDL